MNRSIQVVLAVILMLLCMGGVTRAQSTAGEPSVPVQPSASAPKQSNPNEAKPEYSKITFEKLISLYWRYGFLTPDRPEAVKEFLRFTSCDIYKKFVDDDFRWPEVMATTRGYLEKYGRSGNGYVSVLQPIALGKYIPDKEWFVVTADTQYLNTISLEVANFKTYAARINLCGGPTPKTFPMLAVIKLQTPFSLTYVPMKRQFALDYLDFITKKTNKNIVIKGAARDRYAFVNFKIDIRDIDTKLVTNSNAAIFYGRLDGYDIYADQDMTLPLYSWTNTRQSQ